MDRVRRTQEYIAAGDVYQLVLSARFTGEHTLSPFEVYRALRLINPSPYMYFCELGDLTVVGSSPEALVKLNGRRASLRPIAGTRPRGATPAEDELRELQLRADPKENAEHVMLVDLARNDLGRVAQAGSVGVDSLSHHRALQSRHAHRQRRQRRTRRGQGCLRSLCGDVPRRNAGRRPQSARHGNHRRTRASAPRALRRHRRLLWRARRHGSRHHDSHARISRRQLQLSGGRGHRRGQRAGHRTCRDAREGRRAHPRAGTARRRAYETEVPPDRQL